jgi:two-component system phosphate regulon sensor histidine kinase PhoR
VLKSALFESNETQFHFEPLRLDELLDQVIHSMKLILDKRNARVELTKVAGNFNIEGDCDHLMNVFYNLIDNSIKYSTENVTVKIALRELSEGVSVKISDNGIGIPAEYQKKIFEKFYRVPTGDVHNTKGYGLGLSYVQDVVKSHHGTIDLTSEPSKGSSFTITLPKGK